MYVSDAKNSCHVKIVGLEFVDLYSEDLFM